MHKLFRKLRFCSWQLPKIKETKDDSILQTYYGMGFDIRQYFFTSRYSFGHRVSYFIRVLTENPYLTQRRIVDAEINCNESNHPATMFHDD